MNDVKLFYMTMSATCGNPSDIIFLIPNKKYYNVYNITQESYISEWIFKTSLDWYIKYEYLLEIK